MKHAQIPQATKGQSIKTTTLLPIKPTVSRDRNDLIATALPVEKSGWHFKKKLSLIHDKSDGYLAMPRICPGGVALVVTGIVGTSSSSSSFISTRSSSTTVTASSAT